jgi:hypothetical protein
MANLDRDLMLALARSREPEMLMPPEPAPAAEPVAAATEMDEHDPRNFAAATTTPGADGPDVYGYDTGVSGGMDDVQRRLDEVRSLVGQRGDAGPSGPGERELYYLSQASRPGQDEVTKAAVFGALLGDQKERLADVRGRQSEYDKTLMGARDADKAERAGNAPIDLATAELMVQAGLSPQAAAALKANSPGLRFSNNLGGLELRRREQDIRQRQGAQKEIGQTGRALIQADTTLERQKLANEGKKKGKGGAGAGGPGQMAELIAKAKPAYLAARANVPIGVAERFVAGEDVSGAVDARQIEALKQTSPQFDVIARDPKKLMALINASESREGRTPDAQASALETDVAKKQADPVKRDAARKDLLGRKAALIAAVSGWNQMSPKGKAAMAKLGGGSSALVQLIKSGALSAQDQVAAASLQRLANELIKSRSGAAVSEGEWNRISNEMGFATGDWSVFNSPGKISSWLKMMRDGYQADEKSTLMAYPDLMAR